MQSVRGTLLPFVLVAFLASLVLAGCTQFQTHDTLTSLMKDRSATSSAPTPEQEAGSVPKELSHIIKPLDVLGIEVTPRCRPPESDEQFAKHPISGTFVVRPNGEVNLGEWGSVFVAGTDAAGARKKIREHLTKARGPGAFEGYLGVTVDVQATDERYFVITSGVGGEQAYAFPLTGAWTVRDAIVNTPGLSENVFKLSVEIARKPPPGKGSFLHVDWPGIMRGDEATNYQLRAGDCIDVTVPGK